MTSQTLTNFKGPAKTFVYALLIAGLCFALQGCKDEKKAEQHPFGPGDNCQSKT